jgi:two-component system chemotaxis sensor kinase CheA
VERLDRLLDMVGELVIAESMVSQMAELRNGASPQVLRHIGQLDKITRELQELATSLRMVPIRPVFQKMARLVRDLSRKTGKSVELVMSGEDTEMDRAVVEKIADPLLHMIRNAIDHGLEDSAQRQRAGKSESGHIFLRAFHKAGNICIEIEDDGRGLDREAILAKGRTMGLTREGETLSDREVFALIFLPGFSTARIVTDVSGRGVGMDVVKRNIGELHGQVEIRTTAGHGTAFTIRLPLTLSIIDGMVLGVGRERYVLPTISIVKSIRPRPGEITTVLNCGEVLSVHGELIPVFRLDRLFGVSGAKQSPCDALVVVVEAEGRHAGLLVDELLGRQQIVIKSLAETMRNLSGIAGGAVMPDGEVGLVLDAAGLVYLAHAGGNLAGCQKGPRTVQAA